MQCTNCNGVLIYNNGLWVCESCGSQFSVSEYYDDTEVFLLYIENDEKGRRTKSSIIAQDIYRRTNKNKFNIFFARENISNLFDADFEKAYNSALHSSKLVIVIGTTKDEFACLLNKYNAFFENKLVFPIYADMDAYDIPNELNSLQALSYEKIGYQTDLEKALTQALGKGNYDYAEENVKKLSEKQKRKVITFFATSAVLVLSILVITFFTPLVLTGKKYEYALNKYNNKEYTRAINSFFKIKDYKDSKKLLYNILQKYNGYYQDEKSQITIHLTISEALRADVEVIKSTESAQVKITEAFSVSSIKSEFSFSDSENNEGLGTLEFNDGGFVVEITTEKKNSEIFFDDCEIHFLVSEKSDKPFAESLDASVLLSFLKTQTTLGDLKRKGVEIEHNGALYKDTRESEYQIKNTDIKFAIFTYDISKPFIGEYGFDDYPDVDDPIIFGICAPANILIPDMIGNTNKPFINDNMLFVPDGSLNCDGAITGALHFGYDEDYMPLQKTNSIEDNTPVCVTYKDSVGTKIFNELVEYYKVAN